jgi:hypothetical protein
VRWIATLSGSRQDIERLAAELPDLSPVEDAPRELLLELDDPEGDATGGDVPHAAKAVIDASVRRINGFGRLRWGRTFEGVDVSKIVSIDPEGRTTHRAFAERGAGHMRFEDFANMVERLGEPRPEPPAGLDVINALEAEAVTTLAATNPEVARVLHLVDLMLAGDEEIDWVAAYAALEVIEQDLANRQVDGQALGRWTGAERGRFTGTANSAALLGFRARHGRLGDPPKKSMTSKEASWFIRRVAALWVTRLLEEASTGSDGPDTTPGDRPPQDP